MERGQFYTLEEVAKILKVAYMTIYRWVRSKKLIAYKVGKQYRVEKKDLNELIKKYE